MGVIMLIMYALYEVGANTHTHTYLHMPIHKQRLLYTQNVILISYYSDIYIICCCICDHALFIYIIMIDVSMHCIQGGHA